MRRLRVLAGILRSPRDVWLLIRMAAWALVLPLAKFAIPLPRLVHLVAAKRSGKAIDPARVTRLAGLLYGRRGLRPSDNCLERSLVTFRYLSAAGADPRLVVGMREGAEQVLGHAWVVVDGRPIYDSPDFLAKLVPFVAFDAAGRAVEPAES